MTPIIHSSLMAWLKEAYPPRCRKVGEHELDHERYAGKVDLVAELEERFKAQLAPDAFINKEGLVDPGLGGLTFEQAYGDDD